MKLRENFLKQHACRRNSSNHISLALSHPNRIRKSGEEWIIARTKEAPIHVHVILRCADLAMIHRKEVLAAERRPIIDGTERLDNLCLWPMSDYLMFRANLQDLESK